MAHIILVSELLPDVLLRRGGGGRTGPFSVTCDWPFLKSVICEKANKYRVMAHDLH